MTQYKHILFNSGDQFFSINISHIDQIITPPEVFKVPNTQVYIDGLINIRGSIYTVVNLRKRLKVPVKDQDEESKIILMNLGTAMIGLLVDSVKGMIDLTEEDFTVNTELPCNACPELVSNIIKKDEKIILELNIEKLIA